MKSPHAALSLRPREALLNPAERLRDVRLRPTATRVSILRTVEAMSGPVSASDVFMNLLAGGTSLSIATIYRVLGDFESAGLLVREWIPGLTGVKTVYSILYARSGQQSTPAHRLLCRRCGHGTAFQDAALLEQIRRFTGCAHPDEPQRCLTIETDDCHKCRQKSRRTPDAQEAEAPALSKPGVNGHRASVRTPR